MEGSLNQAPPNSSSTNPSTSTTAQDVNITAHLPLIQSEGQRYYNSLLSLIYSSMCDPDFI